MSTLVVSDLHFGAQRRAGTTPQSREGLRSWMYQKAGELLMAHIDKDLCILGDLFDGFCVDTRDLHDTFSLLNSWLEASKGKLYLVSGNHDWSPKGDRLASIQALSVFLSSRFESRVISVHGSVYEKGNFVIVPHAPNQDLFNLWLKPLLDARGKYILLHANCMSAFCDDSMHSLNVDRETLAKLSEHNLVIFAHEHSHRMPMRNVVVVGNNIPSCVSDVCNDKVKYALVLKHG